MPTPIRQAGGIASTITSAVQGSEQLVDASSNASRTIIKPLDYVSQGRVLGHYRLAARTGKFTGAQSSGTNIYNFRWGVQNAYCVLTRLSVGFAMTQAFDTPQVIDMRVFIGRNWTTQPNGGTQIYPATTVVGSNRMRTAMPPSLVSMIMTCTTTGFNSGTVTTDTNEFANAAMIQHNFADNATFPIDVYAEEMTGQHPIVFSPNEGFIVRNFSGWGANGGSFQPSGYWYITSEWTEVSGY